MSNYKSLPRPMALNPNNISNVRSQSHRQDDNLGSKQRTLFKATDSNQNISVANNCMSPSDSGYDSSSYLTEGNSGEVVRVHSSTPTKTSFFDYENLGFECPSRKPEPICDTNLTADEAAERLKFIRNYTSRRWR
eukprot:CFRG4281T1